MSEFKVYKAKIRGRLVCSVIAEDEFDADKKMEKELTKNPSRRPYYDAWNEDGRELEVVNG